jgi:hypothetical protein
MMPQGPEYVLSAVKRIESASQKLGALDGVEPEWVKEAQERLTTIKATLRGLGDRFFLKTRVCLPFARKCAQAAQALDDLLDDPPATDVQSTLDAALDALEKAARTLDERSMMEGMAIT